MVEGQILDLASRILRRHGFEEGGAAHPFASDVVGPVAVSVARHLGDCATGLLPGFVAAGGRIRVIIAPKEEWHRRRVHVDLQSGEAASPLAATASGVLAWGTACLRFAAERLRVSRWALDEKDDPLTIALMGPDQLAPVAPKLYPLLYLADEPEAHLHPTAIKEVVEVFDQLASGSFGGTVVATHALDFLGAPEMVITPFVVDQGMARRCPPGLPALQERAERLGIPPAMVLMSARAVLCVEGPTDQWVLNTFATEDLHRSYVHTLRLYGMNQLADRLPELDLVYSLDIPVYIMLDHVRASKLRAMLRHEYVADASKEEQELFRLSQALRGRKTSVVPMAKVDVVRAIPDSAVALAFKKLGSKAPWPGWATIDTTTDERWKTHRTPFKKAFLEATGVEVHQLVTTLRRVAPTGMTSPELRRAISALLADLSSGAHRSQTEDLRVLPTQ